jgi:hypothetical protein
MFNVDQLNEIRTCVNIELFTLLKKSVYQHGYKLGLSTEYRLQADWCNTECSRYEQAASYPGHRLHSLYICTVHTYK